MGFKKFDDIKTEKNKEKEKLKKKKAKEVKVKPSKAEKLKLKEEKKIAKEDVKNLKKTDKAISYYTKDVMDFVDVEEDECFKMKYGYMNIYQVQTKDMHSLSYNDTQIHINSFSGFLRAYTYDFKIVSMNFPVNTSTQKRNIERNLKFATNDISKKFLERKLDELIYLEENRFNTEFYIMVFASHREEFDNRERFLFMNQNSTFKLNNIELEKKFKILFKLNNLNTKLN
ncbi:MAG: hypothetical protein ACRDA5_02865 [Clostridium sp.]